MSELNKYSIQNQAKPYLAGVGGGLGAVAGHVGSQQCIPRPEMVQAQHEEMLRYRRADALRMAFEMLKGSDVASDHQAVIRAARDMLTFINDG